MEICGSPQLIDMFTIYHLITNEIDLKNKLPPKRTIHMIWEICHVNKGDKHPTTLTIVY